MENKIANTKNNLIEELAQVQNNKLIEFYDGRAVVSSRKVAKDFERRHAYILSRIDIELKHAEENNLPAHFFKRIYIEPQNKQEYREYLMDEEGFNIITLRIRGKEAAEIRMQYLEAFKDTKALVENIVNEERNTEMRNTIQIFENQEFGKVRTVILNGIPYFVGKDVADILSYQNGSRDINVHVDEEDKLKYRISTAGQMREQTIINESGLYSLILSSKLPAAKKFKRWVTSEVLPAIRKTGSYNVLDTPSYQISDPIKRAEKWIEEEKARQALCIENTELKKENNQLNVSLGEEREFRHSVFETGPLLTWTKAARLIGQKIKIGRQKMLTRLKVDGIIDKDNLPCARYIQSGHLDIKQRRILLKDGSEIIKSQGFVTQKGLEWLIKRFTRILSEEAV